MKQQFVKNFTLIALELKEIKTMKNDLSTINPLTGRAQDITAGSCSQTEHQLRDRSLRLLYYYFKKMKH